MEQLTGEAAEDNQLKDHEPVVTSVHSKQGHFETHGRMLTSVKPDGVYYLVNYQEGYGQIFGAQKKIFDNLGSQVLIQKMKIRHPNVTVLLDCHITCVNRKKQSKTFGHNQILPSSTTWKYPTLMSEGEVGHIDHDLQVPDRKLYFMVIGTPILGPFHDPGQDMHDIHVGPINDPTTADDPISHIPV